MEIDFDSYDEMAQDFVEECNLYVSTSDNRIWEGRLFETFVIMRPLLPEFYQDIRTISLDEFGKEYEDYCGDRVSIRKFLAQRMRNDVRDTVTH